MVSVVVPMLNEIDWIEAGIEGLGAQDYPLDHIEVLIVDGGSTDGSRALVQRLSEDRPWLRLIDNPDRLASAAFNRGIEASSGGVVCIVGAHASVGPDFVNRSVRALAETGAGGVGGKLLHEGTNPVQQAIGLAMTSPLGMASPFRYSSERAEVDTIGHPAYRREVLDRVGTFDESLKRNSDYELNHRIRGAGYTLIFDPEIVTRYRPRASLRALARQFFDYGLGKADVVRSHPDSMKPRHFVAPLATIALALSPVLMATRFGRRLLSAGATGYLGLLVTAVVLARPDKHDADPITFVAAFPVMHFTWGAGFILGRLSTTER